ncbi:hypothetical protein E4T56_gene18439 [Termitomyces sp. T112]|nr:hypothetical protein E4T56_gene18439 [Termitomyces sp. T112]
MPKPFPALPGFYYYFFLYLEPRPGAAWFYHELVPSGTPAPEGIPDRTVAAVWQLVNAYMLLALLQSFGFRAIRDTLANNPAAQERILGAIMMCLAIADATHVAASLFSAPADIRFDITRWNGMSHGNVTFVIILCLVRLAWFAGIGRTRFYFGQPTTKKTA